MFSEMLGSGGSFDDLAASFGLDADGALPEDFAPINNLLNQIPADFRSFMLTEFANRLFVAK